jgi:LemA protein
MVIWIIAGVAIVLVLVFFMYYNRFVILNNRIDNSLAQIDVQLKKRADLVPNLLETVKAYAKYEKKVITEVTNARKAMLGAGTMKEKVKAGNQLQGALKSIFALAENYPNLKANENFLHLQQELSAIEDKVAYARQYYNDSSMSYNNALQVVPAKWFASMYGFTKKDYLQIPAEDRAVPKIKFDNFA